MASDMQAIISSSCRAAGIDDEAVVSTCCEVYADLTRIALGDTNSPIFNNLSVLNSIIAVAQQVASHHCAESAAATCVHSGHQSPHATKHQVGSLDWMRGATRERLLRFTSPATPSVWHIASRNYEEAARVKKALRDVVEEVNPEKVLQAVQAVDVCRVCKSDQFISQAPVQTCSADEPAVWIFRCDNPVHKRPIVW